MCKSIKVIKGYVQLNMNNSSGISIFLSSFSFVCRHHRLQLKVSILQKQIKNKNQFHHALLVRKMPKSHIHIGTCLGNKSISLPKEWMN
jgi:asparagine synthetase A